MFRDHFLGVRAQIIFLTVRRIAYTVVSCATEQIGRFANGRSHLLVAWNRVVRAIMLHSAFEVGGHHCERLPASHLSTRVMVRHVNRSTGVVRVDHAATGVLLLRLLFNSASTVGRFVVTGRATLRTSLVMMRAVMVVANDTRTIHN